MLVTELKTLAKSLNVKNVAKLRKAELIVAIGDAVYDDAMAEYTLREAAQVVNSAADSYRTEVVERNSRRLKGYASQVGKNRFGGAAFTAKQRKRMISKAYRAQKIWTGLMINEGRTAELSK